MTTQEQVESATRVTIEAAICANDKEDVLLNIQAFSDMENQLGCAPMAVAVMGQLAVIAASGRDFSLIPSNGGMTSFQLLKYPTSYRACLTQVGNATFDSLKTAHGNMGYIMLAMERIPDQMTGVVELLTEGTTREIKDQLTLDLKAMKDVAENGKIKVQQVLDKFNFVIGALHELTEASQVAKGDTENAQRDTAVYMKITEDEEKAFREGLAQCEQDLQEMRKKYEEEEKELKEALGEAASWNDFGKQLARNMADTTLNVVAPAFVMSGSVALMGSTLTNVETGFAVAGIMAKEAMSKFSEHQTANASAAAGGDGHHMENARRMEQSNVQRDLQNMAIRLNSKVCAVLESLFQGDSGSKKLDLIGMKDETKIMEAKAVLGKVGQDLKEAQEKDASCCKAAGEILGLRQALDSLTQDIVTAAGKVPVVLQEHQSLFHRLEMLQCKSIELGSAQAAVYMMPIFEPVSPGLTKHAQKVLAENRSKLSETYIKQMFTALEIRREQLKMTEKKANDMKEYKLAQQKKLQETLNELSKFREKEATQKEILQIISKGLIALFELRRQWMQIFLYFQTMDNLVQTTMGPAIEQFVSLSNVAAAASEELKELSLLSRNRLYRQAFAAVRTAQVVHFLAKSYMQVSSNHLLPLIENFGCIIAMDGNGDKEEIERESRKLMTKAENAQKAISNIVIQGHEKFKVDITKRMGEIEKVFQDQLPPLPQPVAEKIKTDAVETFRRVAERVNEN